MLPMGHKLMMQYTLLIVTAIPVRGLFESLHPIL